MKKPFINLMMYRVRRSRWNPTRFLFGEWYLTGNVNKWAAQQDLDIQDIYFANKEICPPPLTNKK